MGLSVAAGALVARQALLAVNAWRAAPLAARKFYEGGFEAVMSRDEALKILGLRRHVAADKAKVMSAYRAAVQGAHSDKGGSDYLSMKVNEARDLLLSRKDDSSTFRT